KGPRIRAKTPELALNGQKRSGVADGTFDLEPVANDPRILQQTFDLSRREACNARSIEAHKGTAIGFPFLEDCFPAQPSLRALEREELEKCLVVVGRNTPLAIVIHDTERRPGPGAACATIHGSLPNRDACGRRNIAFYPIRNQASGIGGVVEGRR